MVRLRNGKISEHNAWRVIAQQQVQVPNLCMEVNVDA